MTTIRGNLQHLKTNVRFRQGALIYFLLVSSLIHEHREEKPLLTFAVFFNHD